jgi:hypothetical protein
LVLGEPPAKNLSIKVDRARRVVSLNLEIDGHRSSPLCLVRYLNTLTRHRQFFGPVPKTTVLFSLNSFAY